MKAKANSRMKRNQPGGSGWRGQRNCSEQREYGASEELKFGEATRVTGKR